MSKLAFFIIALLALVVLASGCIDSGTTNQTSQSTIPTKTFSSGGVSFDYPDNWTEYSADQLNFDLQGSAQILGGAGTSDGNVLVAVQKLPTQGYSLADFESSMKSSIAQSGTVDSSKSITVNGQNGFEIIYTLNSGKKERINGYTDGTSFYLLTMSTTESNFDSQQENFDVVSNSFKF